MMMGKVILGVEPSFAGNFSFLAPALRSEARQLIDRPIDVHVHPPGTTFLTPAGGGGRERGLHDTDGAGRGGPAGGYRP